MKLNDGNIQEKLTEVTGKLDELLVAQNKRCNYITPCLYEIDKKRYNLNVAQDADKLISYLAAIFAETASFSKASAALGREYIPQFQGYSLSDWVTDFQTRLTHLELLRDIRRLTAIKDKLDALVSDKLRKQMTFDDLLDDIENI